MKRATRIGAFRCVLACAIVALATPAPALAAAADLPPAVASRVTRINTALEAVDTALEKDRLTTAQRKLNEANRYLDEITRRYGGKFDESDPAYAAMLERLAAATAQVAAVEQAAGAAEAEAQRAEAANDALCKTWIEKLTPFVDHKSDDCLRIGADFHRSSPEQQARSTAAFPRAQALYDQLQTVSFPVGKSSELKNIETRLVAALEYYQREAASAAQEEACRQWVDTLAPYVDVGMISSKRLIAAPTADVRQIETQQALYEEAAAIFAHYQKAEFPLGKTHRLQTLEQRMEQTLAEFPEAMAQSQAMISGDVATMLDGVLGFLDRDAAWVSDIRKKPPVLMQRDLGRLREAVEKYAAAAAAGDSTLAELRQKLRRIEEKNAEHGAIRAQRTFQRPDGYAGSELTDMQDVTRRVIAEAHPQAEVLRITVPSTQWAIEDVLEFTDTSRTALRRRITRSVRAEVAIKDVEGNTWLQGIYLGQDQLPDGRSWGSLKGHTTWKDPMIAANVGKAPPG